MILITGGTGFIGLHVAEELTSVAHADVLLTDYPPNDRFALPQAIPTEHVSVEVLDICQTDETSELVRRSQIDSIIHLAMPPRNGLTPFEETDLAVQGLLSVLEAARRNDVRRVTIASSVSVYGGSPDVPWRERALLPLQSRDGIGALKKVVEIVAADVADRTGVSVVLLRLGYVYGPGYRTQLSPASKLIHHAARSAQSVGAADSSEPLYADDGRDYCYVKDAARGVRLIHDAARLEHRVYNIGGGRTTRNHEIADAIRLARPDTEFALAPGDGATDGQFEGFMDITRAKTDVGYEPMYSLADAVAEYLTWVQEHGI